MKLLQFCLLVLHLHAINGEMERELKSEGRTEGLTLTKSKPKQYLGFKQYDYRAPTSANENSSYLELVIVVNNALFKLYEEDEDLVLDHCEKLVRYTNLMYFPLNIILVLVDVVIWSERDEITMAPTSLETLDTFLVYREKFLLTQHPNDHAVLLTTGSFNDEIGARTKIGAICMSDGSGSLVKDQGDDIISTVLLMAQMIGLSFGLEPDEKVPGCVCPAIDCIMAKNSTYTDWDSQWSSCSVEAFQKAFRRKMNYCLRNIPKVVFTEPKCGNGFVDVGEDCDCGAINKKNATNRHCCNCYTCQLYPNTTCGTGKCCDPETCSLKPAGSLCRAARNECDLPEFCSGDNEACPEDDFKPDLTPCDDELGYCFEGNCGSHRLGCQFLWGKNASSDTASCYLRHNTKGNKWGSCGIDRSKNDYRPCEEGNELCGMLQCQTTAKGLAVGTKYSTQLIKKSFEYNGHDNIECQTASVDFGLNNDPGLVPNGAKCGDNRMCWNQKCVSWIELHLGLYLKTKLGLFTLIFGILFASVIVCILTIIAAIILLKQVK